MKRIVAIGASVALLIGCVSSTGWTPQQKEEVRTSIYENREKFVLQYMDESDFDALQECVLEALIGIFPEYEEYEELTDRAETLDGMMCDCAVEAMGANYENLKNVFPMEALQKAGWIASGTPAVPETMFYNHLAGLFRTLYPNPDAFVMALMLDSNAQNDLREMISQCASGESNR